MTFDREPSERWHREVPGARWFKADLHVHTIDDWPGKRAKMPSGIAKPESPEEIRRYARMFLAGAVKRGVQVLGLTPHSARIHPNRDDSAVWTIVDEWNQGVDDDGIPFRDKIYAVFPGFEPSLNDGSEGLHLIFLFDPEIGHQSYLKAFDMAMGGLYPWDGTRLLMSQKRAEEVFREFHDFRDQQGAQTGWPQWQHVVLAPHMDGHKGLLSAMKSQVLQYFQSEEIAGLELSDEKLPEEVLENRDWLAKGMKRYRHAFFHSTDAYTIHQIGTRHTWIKLASPRVEALRQAFIASDSRVRIGFERAADASLKQIADPPDVMLNGRAWLKSVTVQGGASFFGGSENGQPRTTCFRLSPDLTCVIGGSMTGKSTFLDGLRHYVKATLPSDPQVRKQVQGRAEQRFSGGAPTINLAIPGRDPAQNFPQRWPADFFAQNELQRLAEDPEAVEDILRRLVQTETDGIRDRGRRLGRLDTELRRLATEELSSLDATVADVEQESERCRQAKLELEEFKTAGVEVLNQVSGDLERWRAWMADYGEFESALADTVRRVSELDLPAIEFDPYSTIAPELATTVSRAMTDWDRIRRAFKDTPRQFKAWSAQAHSAVAMLESARNSLQAQVSSHLASQGISAGKIRELDALNRRASRLPATESRLATLREELLKTQQRFERRLDHRNDLVQQQRDAYMRVAEVIHEDFGDRISVRRVDHGRQEPLKKFLLALSERGITRWWNGLAPGREPDPQTLLRHLERRTLHQVGMSSAVTTTFVECMTRSRRRELAAVRCSDRYILEMNLEGSWRELSQLSGGQRVSVLLTLLLETSDDKPLIIDQPEDELDNRFLFDTVLPALKRLKGRRQIIVATHDANIVVNGDADQVVQLEATSTHGWIAHAGAIEDRSVRDAIVATVDGGDEAFQLRHRKYGF